ncbi:aminoglycoside 3'-phosphotransferase [Streptomyces albofaciens JCM 4342]|uniref:APH(3') family aminoglycoside O-phosphotransferase n=1 Tax=Streptomyces albofaciens TaxID=66866 RepID=UPI00123A6390|nr:APH(3') family aminoglycoside O-phosphotransferase [Streptomyces albofaciens]KAA6215329.1 aminoglycoside 3'-phosphotransferase [Streptomyces albofaciens JCM 4342]
MDSELRVLRRRYSGHEWVAVNDGASGADVFRLRGGTRELFVKVAAADVSAASGLSVPAEAERLVWLAEEGIPVPRVVESGGDGEVTWLVTEAVPGRPAAARWPRQQRQDVAVALAGLARSLHGLDRERCPFDRSLAVTVPQAARAVAEGSVDLTDLDEERAGWSGERLLAELERTRPATEDLVVCHGDLCPDNVLLDPRTCEVTGLIDVGRAGLADRHCDLALTLRELAHEEDPWFGPECVAAFLREYGRGREEAVSEDRLAFYRLLDEFF